MTTLEILALLIVFLNVISTIALSRAFARKPEKLKKKFITALLDSKPIVPNHQPPKTVGEGWELLYQRSPQTVLH